MTPSFFLRRLFGKAFDRRHGRLPIVLTLLLAVSSISVHNAVAQSSPEAQSSVQAQGDQSTPTDVTSDSINIEMKDKLDGLRQQLNAFRESVQSTPDDDAKLADIRVKAEAIVEEMRVASDAMKVRVAQIQGRLTSLGEPPAAGQPAEAPAVAEERSKLENERSQLNLIVDDAGSLSNSATQLANMITNLRRTLFAQTLFRHTELTPDVFVDAGNAFVTEMRNFYSTIGSWGSFVFRFKAFSLLGAIALSVGAAFLFLAGGYRLFGRFLQRSNSDNPAYIKRLSYTFWSTVMHSITFAAFLVTSYLFLEGFNVLRPDVAPMIATFFGFIWFVHFVWKLTYAALAPHETGWRLVRITDRGARLLSLAIIAMAVTNGLDYLLGAVSVALGSPLVLTIAKSLIASVVIGFILIAISFIRPVMAEGEDATGQGRPWPRYFSVTLRVMGGLLLLCVIAGYVGLARFASTQIVLTGAVLALIYIGLLSGKAISKRGAFNDTALGRRLVERHRFGDVGLDQAGLLVGLGIYAIALALGIPLILITWGFQITDIESWVVSFFTEFRIGSISISIVGIFGGLLLFALGYILTRWAQKWIDGNVLARSHVDIGVRNSVKTGIGYLGVGLAVIVGVSAAGINLSNLALVASALSVGIGFGLQNIVSNFVSGLILLVERPFKVGDHVVTGTTEGIVKRISVRATEIETFRQQAIIVPNSDLINAAVGNWTLKNRIQRSEIKVSTSYESDPEKVMAILLDIVSEVPEILRNPGPHVEFLAFGGSSLDFELRFHLADMSEGLRIRNDIRIEILKRFREQGVEIPFPRSEVVYHRGLPILPDESDVRGGA